MNFYFNIDENMCADEKWVANYLAKIDTDYTAKEHLRQLRSNREWNGWYSCSVCHTIWEALDKSGIYHSNSAGWN